MMAKTAAEEATLEGVDRQTAKLVVTGPGTYTARRPRSVLKKAIPGAQVQRTGFPSVFILETEGDAVQIAQDVIRKCSENIGHVTAVLAEVESKLEPIKEAAVRIASEQVSKNEKFCFRLHKRGSHSLMGDTFEIEREIGGVIWQTLQQKYGTEPAVDLDEPDITVVAEVLGPNTAMGISRKTWRAMVGSPQNIPRHWKQAEQQLRDEREKLLSELVVDSAPPDELADGWQDRDSASEAEIRDLEFGHRGAIRQRILQIERALERMKLDTYGRCVRCGRAIDPARLADEPDVSLCFTCQSGFEGEAALSSM
ncbi:MAG TPA: THUMP domain-containing protein [Blastocatellia bacterium]|nr:THUMP domain-containing protein [Blastocatellia bacterium]